MKKIERKEKSWRAINKREEKRIEENRIKENRIKQKRIK